MFGGVDVFRSVNRILGILAVVLSLASVFSNIVREDYLLPCCVAVLGFVLMSVDRFQGRQDDVEALVRSYGRAVYLDTALKVDAELTAQVGLDSRYVYAVGAKSRNEQYLARIERAIAQRSCTYSRVLAGDHITEEMHRHLQRILESTSGRAAVKWNRHEKFGTFVITSDRVVVILPSPSPDEYFGFRLGSAEDIRHWERHFVALTDSLFTFQIRELEQLDRLCENCGKRYEDTYRNAKEFQFKYWPNASGQVCGG